MTDDLALQIGVGEGGAAQSTALRGATAWMPPLGEQRFHPLSTASQLVASAYQFTSVRCVNSTGIANGLEKVSNFAAGDLMLWLGATDEGTTNDGTIPDHYSGPVKITGEVPLAADLTQSVFYRVRVIRSIGGSDVNYDHDFYQTVGTVSKSFDILDDNEGIVTEIKLFAQSNFSGTEDLSTNQEFNFNVLYMQSHPSTVEPALYAYCSGLADGQTMRVEVNAVWELIPNQALALALPEGHGPKMNSHPDELQALVGSIYDTSFAAPNAAAAFSFKDLKKIGKKGLDVYGALQGAGLAPRVRILDTARELL
jgi:hypothetical protein